MMKQYVIAPINNLELMDLGDSIFVLSHLWVKFPEYRKFILEKKAEGRFLTLDNSAAERALVTEDVLIDIVKELVPNEVIAPDVLFDMNSTINNLNSFVSRMKSEGLLKNTNIFFCPQGKTREEWLKCYTYGLNHDDVSVIGFSKIAVPKAWLGETRDDQGIMEGRHAAYDYLCHKGMLTKEIHCLGQGNPEEFLAYDHEMMRSSDSVWPVYAADLGHSFHSGDDQRIATPHDYLEYGALNIHAVELAKENVKFVKMQMGG